MYIKAGADLMLPLFNHEFGDLLCRRFVEADPRNL
jgi:hypothetical protein